MAQRPPNGKWSVLENVRHLLFAEQAHLGQFVPGGRDWSPLGFTPQAMQATRKLPTVDPATMPRVDEVLSAWLAIHAAIAPGLAGMERADVHKELTRNLGHLRRHVAIIERLLRPRRS